MKIADALLLQKDLAEEVARLRQLAKQEGWEYQFRLFKTDKEWEPLIERLGASGIINFEE